MGPWIGIALIKVGGASACGGLEAEGQESFALCLRSFVPQGKLSDTQARRSRAESKVFSVFYVQYSIIPTFHQSIVPLFHHSITPFLPVFPPHYSITPTFHHSISPAHYPHGQRRSRETQGVPEFIALTFKSH
jgi:hypothetical protein